MDCLYQSLYQSQETGDVIRCINQQILCYITACDREQHMLNAAEDAITTYLIPKVEEMLVKDSMEGGEHSMSRRLHQGQQGLFYNGNAYIVNYQFAKGVMCDFYREAGIIPIECAQSVNYEGDRLLSMAQDLDSDMSGSDFVRKYKRNIPFKHRDYLMHGLGLSLQRVAENGFPVSELVDVYAFQRGVSFWVTADKKIMDNAMYVFIGWNRQTLDMSKPMLEDGRLVVGGQEVRRYDIVYEFSLVDPKRSSEQMKLKAQEEGARQADTILKKSEADTASQKERVKSAIDLQRRTRLLEAKQEMIAEIIEKAYEKVINLAPDDYYQMLLSILEAYILPQEGEIYFSVKDLENMPVGFGKEIEEIALAKGGKLTVAGAGRDNIDNGFILAYGGIEENCTIRAMFDAKRDELSDIVHRLLFV